MNQLWIAPFIVFPIGVFLAVYAWNRRDATGARTLALLMAAISIWSLGYALELASTSQATKILWGKIQYCGIIHVPVLFLALIVQTKFQ